MGVIDTIFRLEGGFSDHPLDRGGPTKYGITLKTLAEYLQVDVGALTADDIQSLDRDTARSIYQELYIDRYRYDEIVDDELRALVVDCTVLHGPSNAAILIQRASSGVLLVDGAVGDKTLAWLNDENPEALRFGVCRERFVFIGKIVQHDPSQGAFLVGWLRRSFAFLPSPPTVYAPRAAIADA